MLKSLIGYFRRYIKITTDHIISIINRSNKTVQDKGLITIRSLNNNPLLQIPILVIVDNETASASEILVAALQDNNRATVIGSRTFGKGTSQVHTILLHFSRICLTLILT